MADFAKLLAKLKKEASDHEAGSAKGKCPLKCPPSIFVMVARADNASTLNGISVELSGATKDKKPTGGDGMAKFDPVKPGKHFVKLVLTDPQLKEYIALPPHTESVAGHSTAAVFLQLKPKPQLEVTVVVDKGGTKTPVDDVKVVLTGPSPDQKSEDKKSAKPTGIAKFEKLAPGRYTVEAKLTDKQAEDFTAPRAAKVTVAAKDEKVTIELSATEGNAVRITKLDKWFIPSAENCDIGYVLEGPRNAADRLMLEVHASNYCELDSWNDGLPKFKTLVDTPIFTRSLSGPFVEEKAAKTIDDWKGEANCAKGILMLTAAGNRFANVALSPYTIHFRYYKDDPADAKARIDLTPFWPLFDNAGTPTADTLKVKYAIKETTKLSLGRLVVWDKDDNEVFKKDLTLGDVGKGEHTIDWDGKMLDGTKITAAKMPFRVQIQAHTKKGEPKALALAAMHTEIRLYVHPDTIAPDKDPYVAANDKSSLLLDFAKLFAKDKDPGKDTDGRLWTKFALAKGGFHPGPVNDATTSLHFNTALAEFQRSVPKNTSAPFQRLTINNTGNDDNDTKAALALLSAERRRAWFGKVANKSDYLDTNERRRDFRDPTKTMILWVDDRHWYSDPDWLKLPDDDVVPTIRSVVTGHATALGNRRNRYTWGDSRVDQDGNDIARPWVPVVVDLRILSKTQHLTDKLTDTPTEKVLVAMRQAIGPIRVDWSFDEIDGDTIRVAEVDIGLYNKERSRAKSALEWSLNDLKTNQYVRKDVKRKASYFNCPENNGGIRPPTGVDYYKAPFGLTNADMLTPWKPAADFGRETIATVVHDNVGQDAANLFKANRLGRAGVYFHPSRMAGDGYRLRAQVWFAPHPNYNFANLLALSKRYPRPPQAHSAALRVWRKSSIRGYLSWSPNNSWAGIAPNMKRFYASAHVHIVNELGISDADVNIPLTNFWNAATPADLAAFRGMVKECIKPTLSAPLAGADPRRADANIMITPDKWWPWAGHNQLGILETTPANPPNPFSAVWDLVVKVAYPLFYKYSVRLASELARKIEADQGRMRGHFIVEMRCTGDYFYRKYKCDTCADVYFGIERTNTTTALAGVRCRTAGCVGSLQNTTVNWRHHRCANNHDHYYPDDWSPATAVAANCPICGLALVAQPALVLPAAGNLQTNDLPLPSIGNPIGVSFDTRAGHELWGHELGHNRYMEHAVNAGGANDPQHDAVANATNLPAPEPAVSARWDRTCLMAYTSHLASYNAAKDKQMFCYKCLLKNRGWKIEIANVRNPPAAIQDP